MSQPRQRNPRLSEGEVGRYADWLVKIQETAAARAAAREQFQQENPNPSDDDVRRFWEANSELFPRL